MDAICSKGSSRNRRRRRRKRLMGIQEGTD
jgi:hypothetical protein